MPPSSQCPPAETQLGGDRSGPKQTACKRSWKISGRGGPWAVVCTTSHHYAPRSAHDLERCDRRPLTLPRQHPGQGPCYLSMTGKALCSMPSSNSERSQHAQLAALSRVAREPSGTAMTETARRTYRDSFDTRHECKLCGTVEIDQSLAPAERRRQAEASYRAQI